MVVHDECDTDEYKMYGSSYGSSRVWQLLEQQLEQLEELHTQSLLER